MVTMAIAYRAIVAPAHELEQSSSSVELDLVATQHEPHRAAAQLAAAAGANVDLSLSRCARVVAVVPAVPTPTVVEAVDVRNGLGNVSAILLIDHVDLIAVDDLTPLIWLREIKLT